LLNSSKACSVCKIDKKTGTHPCVINSSENPNAAFYNKTAENKYTCIHKKPYEFSELTNYILNRLIIAFNSRTTNGNLDIATCIQFLNMYFSQEEVRDYIDILIEEDFQFSKENKKDK
jgi:hypothetical protein